MKIYFKQASDYYGSGLTEKYPEVNWQSEYCERSDDFPESYLDHTNSGDTGTYRDALQNAIKSERYLCKVHVNPKDHYWRYTIWQKSTRFYLEIDSLEELANIQSTIKKKFILTFDHFEENESVQFDNCEGLGNPRRESGTAYCLIYDSYVE